MVFIQKGGKIIGTGGYGCIFKPQLKCKGKKTRKNTNLSKLMTVDEGLDEYKKSLLIIIVRYRDLNLKQVLTI